MSQARPESVRGPGEEGPTPPGSTQASGAESSEELDLLSGVGSATTLRSPASQEGPRPAPDALPLVDPGRYAISGELAHGGIGRILRAWDVRLDRPVALKEMLEPLPEAQARFVTEALVTARLQHPSIIPVYEAGRWPGGEPFYAMKLVSGRSLADVIAERRTLEERLALLPHVLAVAEAIAYAHTERIIHRDLKPANVLVGAFGETVVIDWGLAKDLAREEGGAPEDVTPPLALSSSSDGTLTRQGLVVGTPAYMPPEQAAGLAVDERADVYALGAILYHVLAGTQPYGEGSSHQVLRRVVEGPPMALARRQRGLAPDLLAIVAKAMAREPASRYATARELAEDLRRFQTGQIVGAHHYSRVQLARRFLRRYRAAVAVALGALLLLAGLAGVGLRRVLSERDKAEAAHQQAQAQADTLLLLQARGALERDPNEALTWLSRLSPGFQDWSSVRTLASEARAQGLATVLRGHTQHIGAMRFTPDGRHLVTASDDETLRLWDVERGTSRVLAGHTDEVWRLQVTPDGRRLVSSGKDGTLRLWELETGEGRVLATLPGPVSALALGCQGRCVLAASRTGEELHGWDLATGASRVLRTGVRGIDALQVSPEGRYLLLRLRGGTRALLGDLERGTFQPLEGASTPWAALFSSSGVLYTGSGEGHLHEWDPRTGSSRLLGQGLGPLTRLTWLEEGRRLVLGNLEGTVRLWDVASGQSHVLGSHEGQVLALSVSPEGRYVASGSADRTTRLWDLSSGTHRVLRGARDRVQAVAFSPDGRRLAVASSDGQVRLFSVEAPSHRLLASLGGTVLRLRRTSDGRRLVAQRSDGTLRLLEAASGDELPLEPRDFERASPLELSADDRWLAVGAQDGRVHVWRLSTGRVERTLGAAGPAPRAVAFSPDGRWLASADARGQVRLWQVDSWEERTLGEHPPSVHRLAFSPDGALLGSAGADGTVRLWELATGASRLLRGHTDAVLCLAFSPDGTRLATASQDHTVGFWEVASGQGRRQDASGAGVGQVLFSPDGALLASRSWRDGRVLLWDGHTGQRRGALGGHQGDPVDLAFSPDSTRLASASLDRTVRLWDLASGTSRVLRGHVGDVGSVLFLPEGRSLLSTGQDGTLRLWPDDLPWQQDALRAWMEAATQGESTPGLQAP